MNTTSLSYCLGYTLGLATLKAQAKMLEDSQLVAEMIVNLITAIRWFIDQSKIDTDATREDEIAAVQTALPYTKIAGLLPAAPEPARPALITPAPSVVKAVNPQIAELGIRELRKPARGKVPKASKLSKAQLVQALSS